jgi:ABC-2 type transport system permease protein
VINLARAELGRLRSRRVFVLGLIILLVSLAGFLVIVGFSVRQPSQAAIDDARVQYQQARQDYQQNKHQYAQQEKQCRQDNAGQSDDFCAIPPPKWQDFKPKPASFSEMATAGVIVSVIFGALAFLIIGASSIGAEYGSGAIANWLSFVPNRSRVYISKIGVLLLTAAAISALASAVTLIGTGILVKINSGVVNGASDQVATAGRGLILVVICATIGFAVALISRHTIAALGVLLAYGVLDFVRLILTQAIGGLQVIKPWLLETNALAVLNNGHDYTNPTPRVTPRGMTADELSRHISLGHGLTYFAVLFVIMVAVSLVIFRRRDIT